MKETRVTGKYGETVGYVREDSGNKIYMDKSYNIVANYDKRSDKTFNGYCNGVKSNGDTGMSNIKFGENN